STHLYNFFFSNDTPTPDIYTLSLHDALPILLRVTDKSGAASYIKDEQGNVVKSRLNETLQQQIASATGGFYLPLRGANAVETLRSEEHTSELQSRFDLVCRLLLEKKKIKNIH